MELFGFASGSSVSGPHFPFFPESILKGYPQDLMDHPAVPSLPVTSVNFTSMDLPSLLHTFTETSSSLWQKPLARHITFGLLAAAVVYGAWKASFIWSWSSDFSLDSKSEINLDVEVQKRPSFREGENNLVKQKSDCTRPNAAGNTPEDRLTTADVKRIIGNLPQPPEHSESATSTSDIRRILTGGEIASATQKFQRQLIEALSRLDDVRFRLKELESEKELLAAEIDLRKKMIHKLQDENTSERDKRQQAELRMEMMEIENSQLRHLRKELSLRSGQVERLEKFLKEKDELQEKLFEDNVVLPRGVAESRAKEFGLLQSRIQKLEAEISSNRHIRDFEVRCQTSKSSCFVQESPNVKIRKRKIPTSSSSRSPLELKSVQHVSPLNKIPAKKKASTLSVSDSTTEPNITGISLTSNMNSCSELSKTVMQKNRSFLKQKMPEQSQEQSQEESHELSHAVSELKPNVSEKMMEKVTESQHHLEQKSSKVLQPNPSLAEVDSVTSSCTTSQKGVFAQLRAFITGFKDSSSESDFINVSEPPGLLDDLVTGSQNDKANNNILKHEGYPLSDEQSSVFMSASGGSESSVCDKKKVRQRNCSKRSSSAKKLARYSRSRLKDREKLSKWRSSQQHATTKAPAVFVTEAMMAPSSVSGNTSVTSTRKNSPPDHEPSRNTWLASKCTTDSQSKDTPTSESSDGNDADSGDSWIVIMPTVE